jgi:NAD+ kinase
MPVESPSMKRIGILVKPAFQDAKPLLQELVPWLRARGRDPLLDSSLAQLIGEATSYSKKDLATLADLLLVLGGDGTMLAAARLVEDRPTPILGVNVGGLGFLTEVSREELYHALEQVFANAYFEEERLMLRSRIMRLGEQVAQATVLNDVVLNKGAIARMVQLEISINGQLVTGLRGDGLIISTPTGSTAYSLSSGGPILNPSVHALILTPICPHTLTNRPIVIPQDVLVEVVMVSRDEGAMVTFDGQVGVALRHQDTIEVRASGHKTKLIRFRDRNYYEMLRKKLKWGES